MWRVGPQMGPTALVEAFDEWRAGLTIVVDWRLVGDRNTMNDCTTPDGLRTPANVQELWSRKPLIGMARKPVVDQPNPLVDSYIQAP
jgi:hypothetical protein